MLAPVLHLVEGTWVKIDFIVIHLHLAQIMLNPTSSTRVLGLQSFTVYSYRLLQIHSHQSGTSTY